VAVLEIAEHAQVGHHRQQHPGAAHCLALGVYQLLRGEPVHHGGDPQQDHERRVPRHVEQVTGDQQVDLARAPAERHRVQCKHERKEHQESKRIEDHDDAPHAAW
jgi:hypothetical protein